MKIQISYKKDIIRKALFIIMLFLGIPYQNIQATDDKQSESIIATDSTINSNIVDSTKVINPTIEFKEKEELNGIMEKEKDDTQIWPLICIIILLFISPFLIYNIYKHFKGEDSPLTISLMSLFIFVLVLIIHFWHDDFITKDEALTPHIEASILIISAFLTFIAFWTQYQYNNRQKNDLDDERKENNIFHLIDKFDVISHDIYIREIGSHKRAFHFIFYEIQSLYYIFDTHFYSSVNPKNPKLYNKLRQPENLVPICISFVLSGVTLNSNEQIKKRIQEFAKDSEIKSYYYNPINFQKLVNIVLCIQEIKKEELEALSKEERLLLFVNYARFQLKDKKEIPWLGGRRPDLVRYMKFLNVLVSYIFKSYSDETKRNEFCNCIFGLMSEHEIGTAYAISKSSHEFDKILGMKQTEDSANTNQTLIDKITNWMNQTNEMYKFDTTDNHLSWIKDNPLSDATKSIIKNFANNDYCKKYIAKD